MRYGLPLIAIGFASILGCAGPAIRSQSPDDVESIESQVKLVGDVAAPHGNGYIKIEGIGLVTNLAGTGSDPGPSMERAALLEDMMIRKVPNPNQLLSSNTTSLVLIRAYIPPGAQPGDHIDVEVRLPPQSETTSLRGGWLMETRMQELLVVNNQLKEGHVLATAQGPLMVESLTSQEKADQTGQALLKRAKVLGGAIVKKEREFGLGLKEEARPNVATGVRISSQVGSALNKRFHRVLRGSKQGVANPRNDGYIELALHPRYKDNVNRYLRVVRSVALYERPSEQLARIELLERQLLNPVTASMAALRLEGIGKPAINTLKIGLKSEDPEVRFYSAEALAYMDEPIAAAALGEAAREEPAFRAFALTALSAMNDVGAEDQLRTLLDTNSSETRYGAFRALHAMNPRHTAIRGEDMMGQFSYHVVKSTASPMIHVTKNKRSEVVMFGVEQHLSPPFAIQAGSGIQVTAHAGDKVTVSKFAAGKPDQRRVVSTRIDEVIRAMVDVGASYPDVVDVLQQAKGIGAMSSRFEVEAIAEFGRLYDRVTSTTEEEEQGEKNGRFIVSNPLPNLFSQKTGGSQSQ